MLISLFTLAFVCGLTPYLPLLMLGMAARAGFGPALNAEFEFMQRWEFLGPMLALVGLDIVLDKVSRWARFFNRLGWAVRLVAAAIIAGSLATPSVPAAAFEAAGAVLIAVEAYALKLWLLRRLKGRYFGLERVVVGAPAEMGGAMVALFALLLPWLGATLAAAMAAAAVFAGARRRPSGG